MCRNIRVLHNFEPPATPEEIEAAAVQYVRKISGATKPSKANEAAFERAVAEVTEVSKRLLASLVTSAPPRDREVEAAKAKSSRRRPLRVACCRACGKNAFGPRSGPFRGLRAMSIRFRGCSSCANR